MNMHLADDSADPLPKRGDAALVHDRCVVNRVEMVAESDDRSHESFGPWQHQMLESGQISALGKLLALGKIFFAEPTAFDKRYDPHRDIFAFEFSESSIERSFVQTPISRQEDAVQKNHTPADSGYIFDNILYVPFEIAEPSVLAGESKESRNVGNRKVVGGQQYVFVGGEVVAGDLDLDAAAIGCPYIAEGPPRVCDFSVELADQLSGNRQEHEACDLKDVTDHHRREEQE